MTGEGEDHARILVVQTAFLGDVVLITPLLRALREKYENAFLAFMANPAGAVMLEGLSLLDEVIVYDKRSSEKGLAGLRRKAAKLREKNFDTALCAHRSLRSAALLKLAGIPLKIGFSNSAFPWLFNERVPRDPCRHEVERNLALLRPLGGPPQDFDVRLEVSVDAAPPETVSTSNGRKKIGICPGSMWTTKRWHAQKFGEAAKALSEECNAEVYLLGSEEDRETADIVAEAAGLEGRNLAGATTLPEWTAAMSEMDLIITNDSAPTHIAGALQVPVVVIFGPTTPRQGFAPWLNRGRTVEAHVPCRPCGEHGARRCPEGHFKCMELIETEQVVGAARSLLEEG